MDNSTPVSNSNGENDKDAVIFKKPIFIGKIGKVPKKIIEHKSSEKKECNVTQQPDPISNQDSVRNSNDLKIPYKEPKWSGLPPADSGYKLEVLKSGMILETIDLGTKPYHTFGRHVNDIVMAHPTISRCHAIIQYKAVDTNDNHPIGWYLYDLNSSHGTFLNKKRLQPKCYVRIRVGHLLKLGCSTRQFILQGPEEDMEEELEVDETLRQEMMLKRINAKKIQEEVEKKQEEAGVSWGMADDAEEEVDLSDNPFAATNNEELYLDDPKKTLRGYFEREGVPLDYHCEEKGIGQFLCRVELPIEDLSGRPIVAEVIHKGKKKDAVVQCALEACRIIDRHGLLRQAKHEARKRKEKDWQGDDFYDSDEDTFLDRTGAIEKKREKRMKKYSVDKVQESSSQSNKALTYNELVEQCTSLRENIEVLNKKLEILRNNGMKNETEDGDEDELDKFMKGLKKQSLHDKAEISKVKMELQNLKQELAKTERLAEIAKPADLPPLIKTNIQETSKAIVKKTSSSVIIGKRLKVRNRVQTPYKQVSNNVQSYAEDEGEEEVESDEDVRALESCEKTTNTQLTEVKENKTEAPKKSYGPMRPPQGYVIPEDYFNQENDRDLPEIVNDEEY